MDFRANEQAQLFFRSNRFIYSNKQWYVALRDDQHIGPFASRAEAELELGMLLNALEQNKGSIAQVQQDLGELCQQLASLYDAK
jgi:hypothetical protein